MKQYKVKIYERPIEVVVIANSREEAETKAVLTGKGYEEGSIEKIVTNVCRSFE